MILDTYCTIENEFESYGQIMSDGFLEKKKKDRTMDEVEMAGPKSMQTRFADGGDNHIHIHPYTCFLSIAIDLWGA